MVLKILKMGLLLASTATALSLVGCKDNAEGSVLTPLEDYSVPKDTVLPPIPDKYVHCKDGEQLDVKTEKDLRAMLKSSLWRTVALYEDVTMRPTGTGNPLVILEGKSYMVKYSFTNDSTFSILNYNTDSQGVTKLTFTETIKYDIALSPQGKLAARMTVNTRHPDGTPRIAYRYYYFCNPSKLVRDNTYLPQELKQTLYSICTRD
ncbi:MAG: hypothetical protein EAZ57_04515 [Cytophagales bacterium]|nr:MAG: hypothetical protein EAZ67_05535 [Cytophagales bacterium]TAF61259.1 MAG: hypothetical protein EAZ57_04515 [Cytophagales bacterium]